MVNGLQDFQLGQVITAIGGLGTAAFGLVDAAKSAFSGINRVGLKHIHEVVSELAPEGASAGGPVNALPQANILESLEANWVNGNDLASQKAIAKSLIKLHLSPGNSAALAEATSVDPVVLKQVATSIISGTALTQPQRDAYARFDLIVTALLDETYQFADQVYRNWTRALAAMIAVALALVAGWGLSDPKTGFWWTQDMALALLVGILATPLAPIAKDLSTALASAANALQVVKK